MSAAAQQTDAVHTANAASGGDVMAHDAATSAHLVTSRDAEVETHSQSEDEDDDTGLHVIRMSHYARVLGLAAGMSEEAADMLLEDAA